MQVLFFWVLSFFCLVCAKRAFAANEELCPGLVFKQKNNIEFDRNERIFLCGDENTAEWTEPPVWQRQHYLRSILESKGYFNSQFEVLNDEATILIFPGKPTVIQSVEILDFPLEVERPTFSNFIGKKLTSSALNELEELLKAYLAFKGYPCVLLKVEASLAGGIVRLSLKNPKTRIFSPITIEKQDRVYPEAVRRFYPFRPGQVFNQQLLEIATRRLRGSGLLNFSRFQKKCIESEQSAEIEIFHDLDLIKPRIFRIGGGFDTERGPLFLIGWRNSRLSKMGSSFEAKLEASFVEQELSSVYRWYFSKNAPNYFIKSQVTLSHENEDAFEQNEIEASVLPSYKSDISGYGFSVSVGPQLTYVNVIEDSSGSSADDSTEYFLLHSELSLWGHQYEYYQNEPRVGFSSFLTIDYGQESWGLGLDVIHLSLETTFLESIGDPIFEDFVFGLRSLVETTIIDESSDIDQLPNDLRVFMGGSDNFRGFGRKELPFSGVGSLTSVYLGTELRWNHLLPYGLQPFVFADWVALADASLSLAGSERFWAPGLGFRWQSPIGAFRVTYARGVGLDDANKDITNDQFFFSYGEEF